MFTAQWFRLGGCVVHPLMRRYVPEVCSRLEGICLDNCRCPEASLIVLEASEINGR